MQPSSDKPAPRSFLALLFHPGFASDKVTPREVIEARGAVTLFLAIFALATYWVLPAGGETLLLIYLGSLISCLLFLVWLVCDVEINWRLKRRESKNACTISRQELEELAFAGNVVALARGLEQRPERGGWETYMLWPALRAAFKNRHLDCASLLEEHLEQWVIQDEKNFALKEACRNGDVEGVKYFLDLGSDPFDMKGGDWGPLAAAASGKSIACIDLIIDARLQRIAKNPALDLDCDQPLISAASDGTPEIIRHLLANGFRSKINDFERDAGHPQNTPENPLLAAARSEYECTTANLVALLEGGADVHVQDRRGATALHMAAARNYPERVKALLEAGADPNCHDAQGGTPLHWAAESNRVENAKLLRQYGADLDARDIDGTPPIEVAKRKNRQRVLGYLRQWKKEIEQKEMVRLAAKDQAIDLPLNYPKAPRSIEWKAAAALLTRGELKARGIEWSSLDNTAQIHRFAADRHLAEWILAQVPSIALSVYKRVLPPLTDKEGRLEDWELEMQDWRLRPMPPDEPRLPARVTGFTAHPWGRVGLYLVLFDSPDLSPAWGFWYLRQPSARVGTGFPFFRLGDLDDAQLLFWLVLKPFLQKQGIIVPGLTPPDEEVYAGPWHEVRDILHFKERPEWFETLLGKEAE